MTDPGCPDVEAIGNVAACMMVSVPSGVSVMMCSVTDVDQSTIFKGAPLRVATAGNVSAVAEGAALVTAIVWVAAATAALAPVTATGSAIPRASLAVMLRVVSPSIINVSPAENMLTRGVSFGLMFAIIRLPRRGCG